MTKHRRSFYGLLFLAAFAACAVFIDCDPVLFIRRSSHLSDIAAQMFPPRLSYARKVFLPLLATLQMSVTGTAIGAFSALILAPLCAHNLHGPQVVKRILRFFVQILRSFPALILALAATFVFGLGVFAGAAAIFVYTLAIMTRLTYEDIENTGLSSYDALCAMGASSPAAYVRAVVPEVLSSYLSNALYVLEANVRHSAILGYVGAGGIGLLLNEKISWREYDKVGAILLLLFIMVFIIERTGAVLTEIVREERHIGDGTRRVLALLLISCFAVCTFLIPLPDLTHTGISTLGAMLRGFLHPNTQLLFGLGKSGLLYLLFETVCIAFVGSCIGAVIALPLAFLGSDRLMPAPAAWLFRTLTAAIRSVPFLIYGLIFIRVTGPGAFTGALTLSVCSVGLLCKRFIEAIDRLDLRAYHGLAAMGVPAFARIRYGLLPQLLPELASAILYRFDINIREAAILGLVGAGGIGAPLIFAMNKYAWSDAGALAIGIIILIWLIDVFSAHLRKKL